jgi:transcriptional regulator with XRE-family HTH domain
MCSMEIGELGRRLRARRTATGETIASVAGRAGLSVPYIANLENGRGNPTLTALSSLAKSLGTELRVDLDDGDDQPRSAVPASLARFSRLPRFDAVAKKMADRAGCQTSVQRERLLRAMSSMSAAVPVPFDELDWHRVLDVMVLITAASSYERS